MCVRGDLEGAQPYYRDHPDINISRAEEAFREACFYGHLDVAQWLLHIKPTINILANNEQAFLYACQNKYLHVAQWLATLKPEFKIIDEDSPDWTCKVLTDSKDIKWNKNKQLVFLASQKREPGADNLVARLPTDVVRITASYK